MQHEQFKDFQNTKNINNKNFGKQLSVLIFIIFLIRLYLNFFSITEIILITLSISFMVISFIKPIFFRPIQIIFSSLAILLGKIINPIIMILLYTIIFIPFGLILKIFRYDPLGEKKNNFKSYWTYSNNSNKKFFKQQF